MVKMVSCMEASLHTSKAGVWAFKPHRSVRSFHNIAQLQFLPSIHAESQANRSWAYVSLDVFQGVLSSSD